MAATADSKTLIRFYYAFQLFFSLLLWVPIFVAYQQRLGLSDLQIFEIQSIYYIAFCVLEIPTGMMADVIGRRRSIRFGALVLVVANLVVVGIPAFVGAYAGFVLHWVLIALSRSLISGACSAYLYDELAARGDVELYKQTEGNARAYALVGKIACWSVIGFVMAWHVTLPYWLTALSGLCAFAVSLMLPADAFDKPLQLRETLLAPLRLIPQAFRAIAGSSTLALLMLQGVGLFVLVRLCQVNLFQPILGSKGFGVQAFGVVLAATSIFEAVGSARPQWMRRWMKDFHAVTVLTVVMAGTLSVMAVGDKWIAVGALAAFSFVAGISFPIQRKVLNDAIPHPSLRATLLSIESIVDRSVCAWAALQLGDFLIRGDLIRFLHVSAVLVSLFTLLIAAVVPFIRANVSALAPGG
ncbi:MAG: MFS transporter [Clostridia bacterium]|nr:MFS transporter [Deltaproteobacteria bacterium]